MNMSSLGMRSVLHVGFAQNPDDLFEIIVLVG